ncbi:unnamed protein product [Parnassius mnemosyne]|uniref:OTU domain-containing protein n=1 Tax=Parnassius mnemosyne TaxID=213953 RepID=A0AAV1L1K1_9NEOP
MSIILKDDGELSGYQVVGMPKDGSCFFHSISFLVYGRTDSTCSIRSAIVAYVADHWDEMQVYTCDADGDVYTSAQFYMSDMMKPTTYGSASELMASEKIYPFTFEVYENGILRGSFGDAGQKKCLRFTGSYLSGHYDVLIPIRDASPSSSPFHPITLNSVTSDTAICTLYDLNSTQSELNMKHKGKGGRPTKTKKGRPKVSELSRSEQLREAAARYRQKHPEKRRDTVELYNSLHPGANRASVAQYSASHPEVNRAAVARYSASHPEVNQAAVSRYRASHPEVNRQNLARKRSTDKLKFKGNIETITRVLTTKLKDRLESEKIVKWTLHNRQRTLEDLNKTANKLKEKIVAALEKLKICPESTDIKDKFEAFLGKSEHRSNQEPFYSEQAYKVYEDKEKPIEIDDTGKAKTFTNIKKMSKSLTWSCSDSLCVLNDGILLKLKNIFEVLSLQTTSQIYSMSVETGKLQENVNFINNVKSHFPHLRTIIREIYQIHSDCKLLLDIDNSLATGNVDKLMELEKQPTVGSAVVERTPDNEIVEDEIIKSNKVAFKLFSKKSVDTPKLDCMSCNKLCYSRDISSIERLRKPISTDVWKQLLNYYISSLITHSPYICHTCLAKIRANQMPAVCILNDMHVSTVPPEIAQLNDYENILIQRAKAFQVVVTMNPVANKRLPNRQMVKKVKGRTFHLPLPMEETLKKLPKPEDAIIENPELYIIVRSTPNKANIIWQDIVDVNKVYKALQYLKNVNEHYAYIKLTD